MDARRDGSCVRLQQLIQLANTLAVAKEYTVAAATVVAMEGLMRSDSIWDISSWHIIRELAKHPQLQEQLVQPLLMVLQHQQDTEEAQALPSCYEAAAAAAYLISLISEARTEPQATDCRDQLFSQLQLLVHSFLHSERRVAERLICAVTAVMLHAANQEQLQFLQLQPVLQAALAPKQPAATTADAQPTAPSMPAPVKCHEEKWRRDHAACVLERLSRHKSVQHLLAPHLPFILQHAGHSDTISTVLRILRFMVETGGESLQAVAENAGQLLAAVQSMAGCWYSSCCWGPRVSCRCDIGTRYTLESLIADAGIVINGLMSDEHSKQLLMQQHLEATADCMLVVVRCLLQSEVSDGKFKIFLRTVAHVVNFAASAEGAAALAAPERVHILLAAAAQQFRKAPQLVKLPDLLLHALCHMVRAAAADNSVPGFLPQLMTWLHAQADKDPLFEHGRQRPQVQEVQFGDVPLQQLLQVPAGQQAQQLQSQTVHRQPVQQQRQRNFCGDQDQSCDDDDNGSDFELSEDVPTLLNEGWVSEDDADGTAPLTEYASQQTQIAARRIAILMDCVQPLTEFKAGLVALAPHGQALQFAAAVRGMHAASGVHEEAWQQRHIQQVATLAIEAMQQVVKAYVRACDDLHSCILDMARAYCVYTEAATCAATAAPLEVIKAPGAQEQQQDVDDALSKLHLDQQVTLQNIKNGKQAAKRLRRWQGIQRAIAAGEGSIDDLAAASATVMEFRALLQLAASQQRRCSRSSSSDGNSNSSS